MKGLSQPFLVLTDAETNADDKRFRIHQRVQLRQALGYNKNIFFCIILLVVSGVQCIVKEACQECCHEIQISL